MRHDHHPVLADVRDELLALRDAGVRVSMGAVRYLDEHSDDVIEYHNNGASVREIADLILQLT